MILYSSVALCSKLLFPVYEGEESFFVCDWSRSLFHFNPKVFVGVEVRALQVLPHQLCLYGPCFEYIDAGTKKGGLTQTVPTTLENCLICLVKVKLWAVQYFCPCSVPASLPSLLFPRKQWKLLYGKIKSQRKFTNIICESNPVW